MCISSVKNNQTYLRVKIQKDYFAVVFVEIPKIFVITIYFYFLFFTSRKYFNNMTFLNTTKVLQGVDLAVIIKKLKYF